MWANGCNFRKECHSEDFLWYLFLEPEIDISEMYQRDDFLVAKKTTAIRTEGAAVNVVAEF